MKFGLSVVIGKFLPPHRGHQLLIDTATAQSEKVVVIICAKPTDFVDGEIRGQWMREIHPLVRVMVIDDRYDENDSRIWAQNTVRWLGRAPDAVFTSEDYGERYAKLMDAQHVSVDPARLQIPISGTQVRLDPYAEWDYLTPQVRGWFAKRVCVLGAESTGTTTLAQNLAERFSTNWVAEYGREYSLIKQNAHDLEWRSEEFVAIAQEQTRREDAAARTANRVLICDTNAFATVVWHRRYMGFDSPAVAALAQAGRCDLYLLTGDEIPFVQDGMRDGEHLRHDMHGWFEQALAGQSVPWTVVRGSPAVRLADATRLVDELFPRRAESFEAVAKRQRD